MRDFGQDFVRRLSLVLIRPKKIKEPPRSTGPERTLGEWRKDIMHSRQDVIERPGMYLDRSPTGSGKSTADIEVVRQVSRALIVTPSHENGEVCRRSLRSAERVSIERNVCSPVTSPNWMP